MVPVGVPTGASQAELVPENRDESPAGLDKPPRRQGGLAEQRHAVKAARLVRFGGEVKGVAQGPGAEQVVGHATLAIDSRPSHGRVGGSTSLLDLVEQR